MKSIFVRNDDVRDLLDDSLVYLTERILAAGYSISHAVEPANISKSVAKWVLDLKKEYPTQIEIIQHGLDHTIKTKSVKGEFGGDRNYIDQHTDIRRGSDIMSELFADYWFRAFSFPFGTYNRETLRALDDLNYLVITTGVRWTFKRRILNSIGILLMKKHFMGKNIVYNTSVPPGYSFLEIPIVINNTKQYLLPDGGIQKSKDELISEWKSIPKNSSAGVLTHHRYNSQNDINELVAFLKRINTDGTQFTTIERIYNEKMRHMLRP